MSPKQRIDEDALLEAALEEFTQRSFVDASVNTIIERAGISKGSFYYRFESKYALYIHLLRTGVRRKWEYIASRAAGPPIDSTSVGEAAAGSGGGAGPDGRDEQSDLFDEFLFQADLGVQFALEHPAYHRLAVMLSREKGTAVYDDALRDLGQDDSANLQGRIRAAISRGEIRSDFSEAFLHTVVPQLLVLYDQVVFRETEWDLQTARDRLQEYVEFLRHGLATK